MRSSFTTFLLFCFSVFLAGCASLKNKIEKPTISSVAIELKQLDANSQTLAVTLTLKNPNGFTIPITKLAIDLSINQQGVISGASTEQVNLPAKGEGKVTLLLSTNLYKLVPTFRTWVKNPTIGLPYQLTGKASLPLISNGISLDYQGKWVPPSPF
ncbi:LEA type 2 family protein [Leeia sp. TBRC 13508]|uniref:LEA type 2 family protein n=1 Tax=Leeia speluncae TaxID=2884804 RepID=A0ABS8D9G1_9NEIS|nr:LEA type 2 family protein [Leeia speluncae]MCB6184757.1 LEA type 2 family protein [Leeia speluncae]